MPTYHGYLEYLKRQLRPFSCPTCTQSVLPKHYEKHCRENHNLNSKRNCVWCQGSVSWISKEKYRHVHHLMQCARQFLAFAMRPPLPPPTPEVPPSAPDVPLEPASVQVPLDLTPVARLAQQTQDAQALAQRNLDLEAQQTLDSQTLVQDLEAQQTLDAQALAQRNLDLEAQQTLDSQTLVQDLVAQALAQQTLDAQALVQDLEARLAQQTLDAQALVNRNLDLEARLAQQTLDIETLQTKYSKACEALFELTQCKK